MILPIPTIDAIPRILKDRATSETTAFTDKMDEHILLWFTDAKNLDQLLDVERCPSQFLAHLGFMLNAGVRTEDTERTKRQKIYSAIQTHKRRGSWVAHAKLVIDAVTGFDAGIYTVMDADDWVLCGDGFIETGTSWAILSGDGLDPYGFALIGNGDEIEIWGNIYIDCHQGIHVSSLSSTQILQIVENISSDIVPAYVQVYLGYTDTSGAFITYSGGTIG